MRNPIANLWHRLIGGNGAPEAVVRPFEGHENSRRYEPFARTTPTSQDEAVETDREKIIAAARTMCQVFGLGNRILRTYANYAVGNCEVTWQTEDEAWNDKANELFALKSQMMDLRGRESFTGLCRMAVIHMLRDGDVGFIKINNPGFPLLDPIEADRIGPKVLFWDNPKERVVGGVRFDEYQRPVAYGIADRSSMGFYIEPRWVAASDFLHVYDTMRFDASRGISAFAYGALGRSRVIRQLLKAEETAVNVAAKWAVAIQQAGSATQAFGDLMALSDETETPTTNAKAPKVQELFDGMIHHLEPGENVQVISSNRPSPAWTGFMEFLIRDFAIALDLPVEFVWNMAGLTGPAVRMTSRQAERAFSHTWNVVYHRFMAPVVVWWVSDQIANGILPPNPQFMDFTIQRPAHPTIDAGRESAANLAEYRAGLLSGLEICGERGRNVYTVMRQKAREIQYAMQLSQEFGVPVSLLIDTAGAPQLPDKNEMDEDKTASNNKTQNTKPA